MVTVPTLKLVCESKICDLMPCDPPTKRWEASGVLVKDRHYFVVFDDRTEIARFRTTCIPTRTNGLFGMAHAVCGYEGITYNAAKRRYYLLVESRQQASGHYQAMIVEYDDEFRFLKDRPVDFIFKSSNKGFEAVAHVRRDDMDYILALCEGNKCKGGDKGRKPGGGRVQVFEKRKKQWSHSRTIALPDTLPFVDYSGMSIDDGRVAIVSQVNSMLWVGRVRRSRLDVARRRTALRVSEIRQRRHPIRQYRRGRLDHPHARRDGVGPAQEEESADKGLSDKDQSIHIFDIPS